MSSTAKMTGRLVASARALAGISRDTFAKAVGIPAKTIALMEANGGAWLHSEGEAEAICRAFDTFGVIIIDEDENFGAGVRLKFTRQDVNQILRLEGEGGIARPDDIP